jgi:hypothetical protein
MHFRLLTLGECFQICCWHKSLQWHLVRFAAVAVHFLEMY